MHMQGPQFNADGVLFYVRVEQPFHINRPTSLRQCFVTNDALQKLAQTRNLQAEPREAFLALEAMISGVARRLALAGGRGDPLQLASASFR